MDATSTQARKQRQKELLDELIQYGENGKFAKELGYETQGSFSQAKRGFVLLNEFAIDKLRELYNVNPEYLRTGKGEKYLSKPSDAAVAIKANKEGLHIHEFGEKVLDWGNPFLTVLTVPVDTSGEQRVFVVPDYALASYTDGYGDREYIAELPHETIPDDLKHRGTVAKFFVYGDSMEPNFYHGDSVYCTMVEIRNYNDFKFKIQNNYVYIVVAKGRAPMLKRLRYQDGDEFLQCYSDNEDQKAHPPFTIHLSEIRQLWYWRRKYSAHAPKPKVKQDEILDIKRGLHETNQRVDFIGKRVDKIDTGIDDIKKLITANKDINI